MNEDAVAIRQPLQVVRSEPAVRMGFDSAAGFELLLRASKGFAQSDLVPAVYKGNIGSCMIALEMANRMGASPLMVMQNLYIVHGSPSWSSKFLVACFNQCGRFSALRYEFDKDSRGTPTGCRAWAVEKATGERLVGSTVTLQMAKDEGWSTKSGSKWKTMPEQMLMYRAAAFMIRSYAPEISMGLHTDDEVIDMGVAAEVERPTSTTLADIKARAISPPVEPEPTPITGEEVEVDSGDGEPFDPDGAEKQTYAQIEEALRLAPNRKVLDQHAKAIEMLDRDDFKAELRKVYQDRINALGA